MTSYTELWLRHMIHHVWSLRVCIAQMGSDLMVSQLSLGNVANFWCGMQRVQILLHHLTLQLLHSKLEQLLNRQKIRRWIELYLNWLMPLFTPVTIETTGVFGPRTTEHLGHRLRQMSGEADSYACLYQLTSNEVMQFPCWGQWRWTVKMTCFLYKFIIYCI